MMNIVILLVKNLLKNMRKIKQMKKILIATKKKYLLEYILKFLLNDDPNLMPIQVKDIFKNKFPNIGISSKEIEHTITF